MLAPENLLRHQTSPYLLQHADNPVHWRPWGPEALAEAETDKKPILLSIGYAACHWCHVMAHESFEDAETAALMNTHFVNIKLDREERPDIDQIYMSALHAMGEDGGWPLTMFLTPDGTPFWGGTYFPPEPKWGRPSFRQVLLGVSDSWQTGHEMVAKNTAKIRATLVAIAQSTPGNLPAPTLLDDAAETFLRVTDPIQGGLRGTPKFPNPPIFRFLWQNAQRTGDTAGKAATHLLLQRMANGGIYDHLGGGFARYSTDGEWLVPHFEKMLYDNAQLLDLIALAYADRPDPLTAIRAAEIIGWLDRDMSAATDPAGNTAFAASEDADSEGEEGKFYVWASSEISSVLGADAATFTTAYDVTQAGNWEGKNILRRITSPGTPAEEAALDQSRLKLFAARATRERPGRDDKVLADWNGLTITALARAAAVFAQPAWLARAESAFDFVTAQLGAHDGRIHHAWRLGRITAAGLLDDQAAMARAALALHMATGNPARLTQAIHIAEATLKNFAAPDGSFFTTAADATDIPIGPEIRPRTGTDNATPSGNAMLAEVFAILFHLTGDAIWRVRAESILRAFTGGKDAQSGMPTLLCAADLLAEAATVVVTGPEADPCVRALCQIALATPDPTILLLRAPDPAAIQAGHPAHGKADAPAAYVCRAGVCSLPLRDPAGLRNSLRRA